MKTRTWAGLLAGVAVAALIVARPFGGSMALVFASLALVAGVIARDAFVPDVPDRSK